MKWAGVIAFLLLVVGCQKSGVEPATSGEYQLTLPPGFPLPNIPEDNQLTHERVALGKRLFFDEGLSSDNTISCATCHQPSLAFSETNPISLGVNGAVGLRNAPSLANVVYQEALFAEGGVPSLELQAIAPLIEPHEMNMDLGELIERLSNDEEYVQQFQSAYQTTPTTQSVVKALASFQRTLISGDSRFDQYYYQGNTTALNASEVAGMELFFGEEVGCANCHSGFLLTNQSFQNIGLYETYEDEGRARLTDNPADVGKFKVPSLRNVAVTAPYMHNGSLQTLEEVVDHFNEGGVGHENQSALVQPLGLNEQERADLVNFLGTLTDESFLNNPEIQ